MAFMRTRSPESDSASKSADDGRNGRLFISWHWRAVSLVLGEAGGGLRGGGAAGEEVSPGGCAGGRWSACWAAEVPWSAVAMGLGLEWRGRGLGEVSRGTMDAVDGGKGVFAGAWYSAVGNSDRGWWVVLGESSGVGSRGAWVALSIGLGDEGGKGCAAGAAIESSIGWLAGMVGRRPVLLGAALPSMTGWGSLGIRMGETWAFSLGNEAIERRIGEGG